MPLHLVNRSWRSIWQQGDAQAGPCGAKVVTICHRVSSTITYRNHSIAIVSNSSNTCRNGTRCNRRPRHCVRRVCNESCAGIRISTNDPLTPVPHHLIDRVSRSIRNVDSYPSVTSVDTARQPVRRTVGCPREPKRSVPFDGLADGSPAKHGCAETRPVKAAQTVRDGISPASYRHKSLGISTPPNRVANTCERRVAATIPVGTILTICKRMVCIGSARYINSTIVLNVIDGCQRNIRRSVVPVNSIVTE